MIIRSTEGAKSWRVRKTSAKVEVEIEAELGNIQFGLVWFTLSIATYPGGWVGCVSLTLRLTQPKLKLRQQARENCALYQFERSEIDV